LEGKNILDRTAASILRNLPAVNFFVHALLVYQRHYQVLKFHLIFRGAIGSHFVVTKATLASDIQSVLSNDFKISVLKVLTLT
jgi:hypothetical protein